MYQIYHKALVDWTKYDFSSTMSKWPHNNSIIFGWSILGIWQVFISQQYYMRYFTSHNTLIFKKQSVSHFSKGHFVFGNWLWITYSTDRKLPRPIKYFLWGCYCIYMNKILFFISFELFISVCERESWYKGRCLWIKQRCHLLWVLGINLSSSVRAILPLHQWPISSVPGSSCLNKNKYHI